MRRLLRWLLGFRVCVECGVVAAHWGQTVKIGETRGVEEFAYECERCSNDGVAYRDMKRGQAVELNNDPDVRFVWGWKEVPRTAYEPQGETNLSAEEKQ